MEINLRKAHKLQSAILDAIAKLETGGVIALNIFELNAGLIYMDVTKAYNQNLQVQYELEQVLFVIRDAVAKLNVESGISTILAKIAYQTRVIKKIEQSLVTNNSVSFDVFCEKAKRQRENTTGAYSYDDLISVTLIDTDLREVNKTHLQYLKRQKSELEDELLALNVSTKLVLSDEVVQTLKDSNLI